jgi:serine/threonine protein kinase
MTLQPGSILKQRYRIEQELGTGGMGAVYLAYDLTLDIRVAVKENLNVNPESEKQFRREAQILASLRHLNLPRVSDHFILEKRQYLIMDYIEGEDLQTRAERQPPTVEEVLSWANGVCDALTFLHTRTQPIIHRDVKPGNLKLQPDGTVILVDFGLAKEFNQAMTSTGARGLTPGFSPPEQYGTQRTDARSDQYSLAATLYALLTGQKPVDSIERLLEKTPLKSAQTLNPAVPEHVSLALDRAMAVDKRERFPDIQNFHAALRGQLAATTVRAGAPTKLRPQRRKILPIAVGIFAILSVSAIAFVLLGKLTQSSPQPSPTAEMPAMLPSPPEVTASPLPVMATDPPASTPPPIQPTHTLAPSPTATDPVPLLGGGGRIAFVSDRAEGILQIWTMNPDGSEPRQLTFGPGDKTQPRWSPDGQRLLFVTAGGKDEYGNKLGQDIAIMNADGTGIEWVTHSPGDDTDPAWSPDGSRIAFASTRTNNLNQVFILKTDCLDSPEGCQDSEPYNVSCTLDFCAVEFSPAWAPLDPNLPSWLPASHTLAVAVSINQASAQIFLRAPFPGDPIDFDLQDRIVGVDHLTWSPDGSLLAFTWYYKHGTKEIYIVPLADHGARQDRLTESIGNKEPVFSPDGSWIAFTSTRDQNPEIYLMTITGAGERNLTSNPARDMQPSWQPSPE